MITIEKGLPLLINPPMTMWCGGCNNITPYYVLKQDNDLDQYIFSYYSILHRVYSHVHREGPKADNVGVCSMHCYLAFIMEHGHEIVLELAGR